MLTKRQELTLKRINDIFGLSTPKNIIGYCLDKINQPRRTSYRKHPNAQRVPRRDHSKKYYQEIIEHFETPIKESDTQTE